MKQVQIFVSVPPNEALGRIWSVMDQSTLPVAFQPSWGKEFVGNVNGQNFNLNVRQGWWRNSFAPTCTGQVHPYGSGSVIASTISSNSGIFKILMIVFVLIFGLAFGVIALANILIAVNQPPGESSGIGIIVTLISLVLPMIILTIVISSIFLINRSKTKSDEAKLINLLHSLFHDVTIQQNI